MLIHKRYWILSVIAIVLIFSAVYAIDLNPGIQLVSTIPAVFQEQKIQYEYNNGLTFIKAEQEHVNTPIIHDDQALYVLNGATDEFKNFHIDKAAQEIVIRQNIMSPKSRNKPYFQLLKVPSGDYKRIINGGKVRIRIQYMYLGDQSTLLEYDLNTKKTKLISYTLVGK